MRTSAVRAAVLGIEELHNYRIKYVNENKKLDTDKNCVSYTGVYIYAKGWGRALTNSLLSKGVPLYKV